MYPDGRVTIETPEQITMELDPAGVGSRFLALALDTLIEVVLYVAIDVLLVFLRPHFSVLHNAESDYGSEGRWAWVMDVNFVLRGALSLAVVRALSLQPRARSRVGLWALGIWAV